MLIFTTKIIYILADKLGDILPGQHIDARPKRIVELQGEHIGKIEHVALRETTVSAEAIPTHGCILSI